MTDDPTKDKPKEDDVKLDPLTEMSKRLDGMQAMIDAKNKELETANKNMAEMMEVNKKLYAQANSQIPKGKEAPTEKSYDQRMIESAVGTFKGIIG